MRVVLLSYAFAPSVGGIESVSSLVADGLRGLGHTVTVVTQTPGDATVDLVRAPSAPELIRTLRAADVVLQSQPSVRLAWPLVAHLVRRPTVAVIHGEPATPGVRANATWRLKQLALPKRHTYGVSEYITTRVKKATGVLPNPFDSELHKAGTHSERLPIRNLVFVGRLVSEKGLDTLLRALARLRTVDERWRATVVGDGPERAATESLAQELNLGGSVEFCGTMTGRDLTRRVHAHRIMVIPSRGEPQEPFGIVALEALAAGLVPVASASGGLPEAVGGCGRLVPPGDVDALADALADLAGHPELLDSYLAGAPAHLARYLPSTVATEYEAALARAMAHR